MNKNQSQSMQYSGSVATGKVLISPEKELHTAPGKLSQASGVSHEPNGSFLNSLNHFRAIAVIFIVAAHSFGISRLEVNSTFEKTAVNLIAGGTILFVFISGFLFHHIFYKKYQYKNFLIGKIKNVLIPYLLLGAIPVSLFTYKKIDGWDGLFVPNGSGMISEYIVPALKYYSTGAFLTAYWYIPFILATFMLSPLHFWFIKSRPSIQFSLTLLLCIVSLFIHRPVDNLNIIHSVIYFTPVYFIGIICSVYKHNIYKTLAGMEPALLALIVFLAATQANLGYVGNYHKLALVYAGLDMMFIQKIVMCLFFMLFLHRFETVNNKYIYTLAATSFTVYFLHPFILWLIKRTIGNHLAFNSWMAYTLYVAAIVMLCVVIAKTAKKIMPQYSRFLFGY